MNELTIKAKNSLDRGNFVTQEVDATSVGFRRWVAIYPLSHELLKAKYWPLKYKVMDFEIDAKLVDEYFGEESKKNLREYFAASEIELLKILSENGIDARLFDVPWKNDYPL